MDYMDEYDYFLHLMVVGDRRVGKSSIIDRYVDDLFNPCPIRTLGLDIRIKTCDVDDIVYKLLIWDN